MTKTITTLIGGLLTTGCASTATGPANSANLADRFAYCETVYQDNLKVFSAPEKNLSNEAKQPNYPRHMLLRGEGGCVVVVYDVGPDKLAQNIRVLANAPTHGQFEETVVEALKQTEFKSFPVRNHVAKFMFKIQ